MRDELGATRGDRACQVSATAVSEDRDAPPAGLRGRLDRQLDALGRPLGTIDVEAKPGPARPVSDQSQPRAHQHQALVAGEEARHRDHMPAIACGNTAAVGHRIDEQARRLQNPAGLTDRIAPPPGSPSSLSYHDAIT